MMDGFCGVKEILKWEDHFSDNILMMFEMTFGNSNYSLAGFS